MARNSTMVEWGGLTPEQYLFHDREWKFCPAFPELVKAAGLTLIKLHPHSTNLNAYAERWVRFVKEEVLSGLILLGEGTIRKVLNVYGTHEHQERNHQGKRNGHLLTLASQGTQHVT